jgi:hypothetical protein
MVTEWRVVRQPSGTVDTDFYDAHSSLAVNRYASYFEAWFEDPDGTKADDYPRGQRADLEYSTDSGSTWTTRQSGFVLRPQDIGWGGGFKALFVGYDHLLRRNPVFESVSSVTVSSALQTVVENHTPLTWNASNVTIVNDATLTREFKGERADEAISWLLSHSAGEDYYVNSDFEFVVTPRETVSAPSNLLEGDWFDYDLPEEGRFAVNFVRVFYGSGGSESYVIVEDNASQKALKDSLGAPRAVTLGHDVTYPEIDNEDAAKAKGDQVLNDRSVVLTGEVKTWGRLGWEPGDLFRLQIGEKGIDSEYRAAQIDHRVSEAETTIKVAQNTDHSGDLLRELSDDIVRIDMRDADPDATYTRFSEMQTGATVKASGEIQQQVSGTAFTTGLDSSASTPGFDGSGDELGFQLSGTLTKSFTSGTITITVLDLLRDLWQGDGTTTTVPTHGAIGTGTAAATIGDTALDTEVARNSATVTDSGSYEVDLQVQFSPGGALEGTDITEAGFFTASSGGDLHARATIDDPVTHTASTTTTVNFTLTFDTDPQYDSVITNGGQTLLRDLYLGDSTDNPSSRAYGTGTADASESDSALGTKVSEAAISETADVATGETSSVMRLASGDANGNDLAEFGDENGANTLASRVVIDDISKTSDFALETNIMYKFRAIKV